MARDKTRSAAAYTLVDISALPAEIRQEVTEDALAGGGEYGIRVVEEVLNGAARAPLFGYYHVDAEKWNGAKEELGIAGSEVDDAEVIAGAGVDIVDPRGQAALRQAAEQKAAAQADAIRTAEDDAVRAVLEGDEGSVPANTQARAEPNVNIVDATVDVKHTRDVKPKTKK